MSGLSIGKNRALRFCQASAGFAIPAKTRNWEENLLSLVDCFFEALSGGERGQGFRVDFDLFAVPGAAAGARLAFAGQEGAEATPGDAFPFPHVGDDRVEPRFPRLAR